MCGLQFLSRLDVNRLSQIKARNPYRRAVHHPNNRGQGMHRNTALAR